MELTAELIDQLDDEDFAIARNLIIASRYRDKLARRSEGVRTVFIEEGQGLRKTEQLTTAEG